MNPNFNRLGNCNNHYQGFAKRVLCVCSAGLLRSPTTANILHREFGYNTRAAGASTEFALIPVDEVLIEWAEEVVFMERSHYTAIAAAFPQVEEKETTILNVPDRFGFMDVDLQKIILEQYKQEKNNV